MSRRTIEGIAGLEALTGQRLGHSDWLEMTQERVDLFSDATLDHQWIHVDVARAQADSPFGGPIAHGYLTLSLLPHFLGQIMEVTGVAMAINYGLNRLRFPSPVPVGCRVRLGVALAEYEPIAGGAQVQLDCSVEIEDAAKPALVAEVVFRYYV